MLFDYQFDYSNRLLIRLFHSTIQFDYSIRLFNPTVNCAATFAAQARIRLIHALGLVCQLVADTYQQISAELLIQEYFARKKPTPPPGPP